VDNQNDDEIRINPYSPPLELKNAPQRKFKRISINRVVLLDQGKFPITLINPGSSKLPALTMCKVIFEIHE
jgi:hypothetical protein